MPSRNNDTGISRTLRKWAVALHRLLRSSRGKDFFIFLFFLGVSYIFWIIMTLNDDIQQDVNVNLEITNIPENYTFISEPPRFLQVGLRDKGTVLANYSLSGIKTLRINYSDFTYDESKDRITLTAQQLNARLRNIFDPSTQIISIRPDSLNFIVTDRMPNLARVIPEVEATPASQFVISGPVTVSPDTVKVYSARHLRVRPSTVKTVKVTRSELKDTLVVEVRLQSETGTRIEPGSVKITVPVEPLISKRREIAVQLVHTPENSNIVLFPSRVNVSYLLPMSLYNSENTVVTVSADYARHQNGKIPLTIGALPDFYRSVELSADSVEYLIEHKNDHL